MPPSLIIMRNTSSAGEATGRCTLHLSQGTYKVAVISRPNSAVLEWCGKV